MAEKDFNPVKAAFYLIAFVIAAHVVSVFLLMLFCLYESLSKADVLQACTEGKIGDVLAAALAAALAFAGGRTIGNGKDK